MAFSNERMVRNSEGYNAGKITLADATVVNGPRYFSYATADDTAAQVGAANYFIADAIIFDLAVDDIIMCVCSDANTFLQVTAVDTEAKTMTTTPFTAAGAVDTANIEDGAVTNAKVNAAAAIAFSKLEVMTSGNILVGSAANVAAEVTMAGDVTIVAAGTTAIGANKVLSSMMSPLVMKYAAVTLSAAQFNGMYGAPVVLVAAGGANTLITLHRAELAMTYVSAQYAAGGVVAIQYDSTINGAGIIASTTQAAADFADAASTSNAFEGGIVKQPFATCVNKALYLSNVTQAFTTGDSTFVMHLWYSIIPTV
jgi:hypothetical protein